MAMVKSINPSWECNWSSIPISLDKLVLSAHKELLCYDSVQVDRKAIHFANVKTRWTFTNIQNTQQQFSFTTFLLALHEWQKNATHILISRNFSKLLIFTSLLAHTCMLWGVGWEFFSVLYRHCIGMIRKGVIKQNWHGLIQCMSHFNPWIR